MARVVGDGQFVCEARRLADLIADGGLRGRGRHEIRATGQRVKSDVFLFSFEWEIDALALDHVIHGLESNIIFGNNYTNPGTYTLNAQDQLLHQMLAQYWTRFARTGNPNGVGLPDWPVYRKNAEEHLTIGTTLGAAENLGAGACELWGPWFLGPMLHSAPAVF
jgi:para-nitrobenzyl esterase